VIAKTQPIETPIAGSHRLAGCVAATDRNAIVILMPVGRSVTGVVAL